MPLFRPLYIHYNTFMDIPGCHIAVLSKQGQVQFQGKMGFTYYTADDICRNMFHSAFDLGRCRKDKYRRQRKVLLPLFALLPIIVPFRIGKLDKFKGSYDKYAMIFIIGFMATLILAFATKYY